MDNSRPKYKKNLIGFWGEFLEGIFPHGCLEYTLGLGALPPEAGDIY